MTDEEGKRHRRQEEEEKKCLVQNRVIIRKDEDMIDEDESHISGRLTEQELKKENGIWNRIKCFCCVL